jgi:hypothetical protein
MVTLFRRARGRKKERLENWALIVDPHRKEIRFKKYHKVWRPRAHHISFESLAELVEELEKVDRRQRALERRRER